MPEFHTNPHFAIGEEVWYLIDSPKSDAYFLEQNPDWTRHRQDTIGSISCLLTKDDKLIVTGYHFESTFMEEIYKDYQLYKNEADCISDGKWIPCEGITPEEWMKALGDRNTEETTGDKISHYDAELAPCCANISAIRDLLYVCQENNGLIQRDKDTIQRYLNSSHPEILDMPEVPTLAKILKTLGVVRV